MRVMVSLLLIGVAAPPLAAQEWPGDWQVRFDRANAQASDLKFTAMDPGWHITTGPAGIFYDPARSATGEYSVEAEIFLFDPGRRHREAYGLFVGGEDLAGDGQSYLYFLVRDDGNFLIKTRSGSETTTVTPWTASSAIVLFDPSETSVKNVLGVVAGEEDVEFSINGETVATLPRADIDVDGIVGLRVNHSLNLHVGKLEVSGAGK